MAEIQVEGVCLGYTEKGYDFTDDSGERRVGTTQRLHVLVGTEVLEIRVPDDRVALAKSMPVKGTISVLVSIPKGTRTSLIDADAA